MIKSLEQDLAAARISFNDDNFRLMNIFANRVMSDAVFMTGSARRQGLLAGFFIRDVAFEMNRVSALGKAGPISTAKAAVKSYLDGIADSATKGHLTVDQFWKSYNEYANRVRKFGLEKAEERAYSENEEFTAIAARYLLDFLKSQERLLLDSRNLLLEGILNEIIRIYRVHGTSLREAVILSLLTYLQRVYNYIRYSRTSADGNVDQNVVESEIFSAIEKIRSVASKDPLDLEEATKTLESLMVSWREYFIRYVELPVAVGPAVERGIQLPEETKKKITEAITKDLGREARRK